MKFDYKKLHTNTDRGEITQGTIGYASDDLGWIMNAVEFGNPIKRKFAYMEKDGDMHPFCVVDSKYQISLATTGDFLNFAYFYEIPQTEVYSPLDFHNADDIQLLLSKPIVKDCRIRNVLGIDTDTETCFVVQDDECPDDKTIIAIEPKELLANWTFLDGSKIGKINESVKFDESRLYGSDHNDLEEFTCGYLVDNVEHFKNHPEEYVLQEVTFTNLLEHPYFDGYNYYPFFYKSDVYIHEFKE